MMKVLVILACCFFLGCLSEVVDFPALSLSTEYNLTAEELSDYADVLNTGSFLFKIENELEKGDSLSLNIKIRDLMTDDVPYFRAHPVFVKCLQKVITHVQNNNQGMKVNIVSAYKSSASIGGSTRKQDLYAASGTGAVLTLNNIASGATGDITKIAEAALMFCPTIFAGLRQYTGLIMQSESVHMQSESVHIHMTGVTDTRAHYFSVDGYTAMTSVVFNTWATEKMDSALDPVVATDCSPYASLSTGQTYPDISGVTAVQVVGSVDSDVDNEDDYMQRLVIYPGSSANIAVEFTGEFFISPRMYEVIRKLQYLVRNKMSDKLNIIKLFAVEGDSLHLEGRRANLDLVTSNSVGNIEQLSKLARCAGADYVLNEGGFITVAVKKQNAISAKKVKYPVGELIPVSPAPAEVENLQGLDKLEYPLFDGEHQMNKKVSDFSHVSQYMSPASRYFRLDPAIAKCYDNILRYEKKWNSEFETTTDIPITHSFLTMTEITAQFDPNQDTRADHYNRGQALFLKYADNLDASRYNIHRLVDVAIHRCSPVFNEATSNSKAIGIGVYGNGIYLDMREEFMLWIGDEGSQPEGLSQTDYYREMEDLSKKAILGRVVNPENPGQAQNSADMPHKQSVNYRYVHPGYIVRRRRKRSAGQEEQDCTVERDSTFCERSRNHRQNEIDHLWEQLKRKHMVSEAYEANVKAALIGCFGTCGTCRVGEVYEEKLEQCNNLLHWVDFGLGNGNASISNFFHLENYDTRAMACAGLGEGGKTRHCVTLSPLFAIFASSFKALFRPDPTKSIEEELYGAEFNPSAVPEIIYQMYAFSANGTVTVWVNNEEEMKFLRSPLKVAMLYNKLVTDVKVMVVNEESVNNVGLVLEGMISDWVRTGYPLYTRRIIAPYSLNVVTQGAITKRDVRQYHQFSFTEQKLLERRHFEEIWAAKVRR